MGDMLVMWVSSIRDIIDDMISGSMLVNHLPDGSFLKKNVIIFYMIFQYQHDMFCWNLLPS